MESHYPLVMHRMAPEVRGAPFCTDVTRLIRAATIAAAVLALCVPARAAELQRWTEGELPFFILPTTDAAQVALSSLRGSVVIVHFFATWCEPCRAELPRLNRLIKRSRTSVKVLAIAVADSDAGVRRFLTTAPVMFPVLLDRDRAVTRLWLVYSLPTTFLLNADLKPRLAVDGAFAWDSVDIRKLIDAISAGDRRQLQTQAQTH